MAQAHRRVLSSVILIFLHLDSVVSWMNPTFSARPIFTRPSTRTSGLQMINFPSVNLNFGASPASTASKREECKKRLLNLISRSKQGSQQTAEEKNSIFAAMCELESLNICDAPVESDLISGKWSLLYTAAAEEDIVTRREKEGVVGSMVTELSGASDATLPAEEAEELPLGRRLTTFTNTFVQNKGNFQDIDASRNYVENRAAFTVGGMPVELKIEGRCSRVSAEEKRLQRLDVFFEKVVLRAGDLQLLAIPLTFANGGKGPIGWVDTTYLDETMRLGRGDKGSFFVTVRRPE